MILFPKSYKYQFQLMFNLLLLIGGIWSILASYYHWKSFFRFGSVELVQWYLFDGSRKYTRFFYAVLGVYMLGIGLANLSCMWLQCEPYFPLSNEPPKEIDVPSKPWFIFFLLLSILLCLWFLYRVLFVVLPNKRYTRFEIYTLIFVILIGLMMLCTMMLSLF